MKAAVLLACWIAALAGAGANGSRVLSPHRLGPPRAGLSVRSRASCLPRDGDSVGPSGTELASGANLSVNEGQVVYVTLVEPVEIGSAPSSFPWPTPRSSNAKVLVHVPICKHPPLVTSLAVTITAFRAVSAGTATVRAPLSRAWQKWQANPHQGPPDTPQRPFQSFRANVTVRRN